MKKAILLIALVSGISLAQTNNNGLGLWFADYGWGLDFKHLNSSGNNGNSTTWDVYLGSNADLDAGFYFVYNNIIKADASAVGRFPLYWGPNIGFGWWDDEWMAGDLRQENSGIAIRPNVVGGISWFFPTSLKMDISAELYAFPFEIIFQSRKSGGNKIDSDSGMWMGNRMKGGFFHLRLLFHAYFF